jgi:NitT/TauT family transport system substrate-binding protein
VGLGSLTPRLAALYLASDLGYYREQGLDVKIEVMRSATAAQAALSAGDIQIAMTGLSAAFAAKAAGADVVVVGGLLDRSLADLIAQPNIRTAEDLKGKRIGVVSMSGTVYARTAKALERLGLDPDRDNIAILTVGDEPTLAAAVRAGAIDAAAVNYAFSRPLRADGYFAWDLAQLDVFEPSNAITVAGPVARNQPEIVDAYLKALIQAIAYMKTTTTDAANRQHMLEVVDQQMRIPPEQALLELEPLPPFLPANAQFRPELVQEVYEFMLKETPELARYQVSDLMDDHFIHKIEAEGFLARLYPNR